MDIVILTALGVGGATIFGAFIGLVCKKSKSSYNELVMSFCAGIMLSAAFLGLIIPSLENGGEPGAFVTAAGLFAGAAIVYCFDILIRMYKAPSLLNIEGDNNIKIRRALTFATAIAIHNLPEGVAAGVGFGGEDASDGFFIATAIALQNIPEGMAVFVALLSVGISTGRTLFFASMTGVVEIFGTFLGYFAVSLCTPLLSFILALAGGSMLYIISDEMMPAARSEDDSHRSTFIFLLGFALMLILDTFL